MIAQAEQQVFRTGSDLSVQTHIDNVVWSLNEWIGEHGRLPVDDGECFDFGVFVNQLVYKPEDGKDSFEPMEQFRRFWSTMTGLMKLTEGRRRMISQRPIPDNILPFNRNSRG